MRAPEPSEFRTRLAAFVRKRVRDPHDAEDLVQDILLRMIASLDSLEDGTRMEAWAYRIARNAIADYYRARPPLQPEPQVTAPQTTDASPSGLGARDAESEANDNQLIGLWLQGFLATLPEKYRDAVWLSDVEGLPQAEVARRLHLSVPGAKSRIRRGRLALRKLLAACCDVTFDPRGNAIDWKARKNCGAC